MSFLRIGPHTAADRRIGVDHRTAADLHRDFRSPAVRRGWGVVAAEGFVINSVRVEHHLEGFEELCAVDHAITVVID
jgi:hypothetical protein